MSLATFAFVLAMASAFVGYTILRTIGAPRAVSALAGIIAAAVNGFVVVPNVKTHLTLILTVSGLLMVICVFVLARGARRRRRQ